MRLATWPGAAGSWVRIEPPSRVSAAKVWGPLGFLASPLFLAASGPLLAAALTWVLLPRFWERMPRDHGKVFAVDGSKSQGKPTGTGFIFMIIYVFVCLLVAYKLGWIHPTGVPLGG